MRPYHPANLKHQPFPAWRVIALAWAGKLMGVQFKIGGMLFGAEYDRALWRRHEDNHWGTGPDDASGSAFRVDREGNCIKPERRIVMRGRTAG